MHPPLFRPHPDCEEFVRNLTTCHEENKFAKFWGACNQRKTELDWCFKAEKESLKAKNLAKARDFERLLEERHGKF